MRFSAAAVVLAVPFAFACGTSPRAGSGSVGQPDAGAVADAGQLPADGGVVAGPDGGVAVPDAGGGPVASPDAGSPGDAGAPAPDAGAPGPDAGAPAPDAGPPAADGGTAASDCPRSFDAIPAAPAALQTEADTHAGALMTPVWEIRAPANFRLEFEGLMDSRGNLFWAEDDGQVVVVASASKDGNLRFRAPTALSGFARLRLAGDTLVGIDNPQTLPPTSPPGRQVSMTGFSTQTGQPIWTTDLDPIIQGGTTSAGVFRPVIGSIAVAENTVVVTAGGLLIAVDAATGTMRWSERLSTDAVFGTVSAIGSPGGILFVSIPIDGSHQDLAKGPVRNPPSTFFRGGVLPQLLAAPGPVLLGASIPPFAPTSPAFFCQSDAHLIAQFDGTVSVVSTLPFVATTTANSVWLRQGTTLLLYDLNTGKLKIRADAHLPPGDGPFDELHPMVESDSDLLWIDQTITFPGGRSADRQQGPPTLHVFQADGREVRKRALPIEAEAYTATGASFGDRVFLGGEILPSAGAFGAIRAFDIPGWSAGNVAP